MNEIFSRVQGCCYLLRGKPVMFKADILTNMFWISMDGGYAHNINIRCGSAESIQEEIMKAQTKEMDLKAFDGKKPRSFTYFAEVDAPHVHIDAKGVRHEIWNR